MSMAKNEYTAHTLADRGIHVFPCLPGEKAPATKDGFYSATVDHAEIQRLWRNNPDRNVAVRTGAPFGPDIVDVDKHADGNGYPGWNKLKRAGLVAEPQAVVQTPSGGMHAWFQGTKQQSGRVPSAHIDFKSTGGYCLVPPSQVNRRPYVLVQHQPSAETFDWDRARQILDPQPERSRQPVRQAEAGSTSLDRLAAWVAQRQEGDRNFPLFYAAKQAHMAGQLDHEGVERLVDASLQSGLKGGEREARRTIASAQRHADREASPFARQREREAG